MKRIGIYGHAVATAIWLLFFVAGCKKPSDEAGKIEIEPRNTSEVEVNKTVEEETAELVLKFVPADSTIYKVALETGKSVRWESQAPSPSGFQGGHTSNRMEMTFSQQIESVEDQGNAIAQITVKELKYVSTIKDNVVLDFDSSREKDHGHPLNSLIGQRYTIETTPSGQVSRVIDASDALAAAAGDKIAVSLLSADAIEERHAIPALPATGENRLRTGDSWSNVKSVSFDMMGAKAYERVYTLGEIDGAAGHKIAIVRMEAVPSVENVRDANTDQAADAFSRMFDNTEDYTGRLKLDLAEGKVVEYSEELVVEWLIVDPNPKKDQPPAALKMAATRQFSIEKLD